MSPVESLGDLERQLAALVAAEESAPDWRAAKEWRGQADDLRRRIERLRGGSESGKVTQSTEKTRAEVLSVYQHLAGKGGDLVSLAVLRGNLPHLDHDELTAVLKQMDRERLIQLDPESNQKAIPKQARDASIRVGGEEKHYIRFM